MFKMELKKQKNDNTVMLNIKKSRNKWLWES